jgi:hypothetical protein
VDGPGADHSRHVLAADPDGLTGQVARIQPADDIEAEGAFLPVVLGGEHQANLVHVSRHHHAQALIRAAGRAQASEQHVAKGVYLDLIGMRAHLLKHDGALAFVAGKRRHWSPLYRRSCAPQYGASRPVWGG